MLVADDDAAVAPAARARLEAALAPLAARGARARPPLAEADAPAALRARHPRERTRG